MGVKSGDGYQPIKLGQPYLYCDLHLDMFCSGGDTLIFFFLFEHQCGFPYAKRNHMNVAGVSLSKRSDSVCASFDVTQVQTMSEVSVRWLCEVGVHL